MERGDDHGDGRGGVRRFSRERQDRVMERGYGFFRSRYE